MPASAKKSRSRQSFEAIFDQQARRFSAFDLLGLSSTAPATTPRQFPIPDTASADTGENQITDETNQYLGRQQVVAHTGLSPGLGHDGLAQDLMPDYQKEEHGAESHREALGTDSPAQDLRTHGLAQDQTVDPQLDQTVEGLSLGHTVWPSIGQTPTQKKARKLLPDRPALAKTDSKETILLAPLQWEVWIALQDAEAAARITSYRHIAQRTNSTIDGVRKAVRVLQKEGGILFMETVRTAHEQGFRVKLNREVTFRRGTLNEAKAILKRGLSLGQTPDRKVQVLGPDGLRMSVCNNINIKQTDIGNLLRVTPPEWEIRERTLIQIADALPDMTAIEFRLSLAHLVKQARQSKQPIHNYNAWVKAAFEKSKAPLVTEREIEARFEQKAAKPDDSGPQEKGEDKNADFAALRRYLTCNADERAEIDRLAHEKSARWLTIVAEDKRPGILEEARLEAIREFFAAKG